MDLLLFGFGFILLLRNTWLNSLAETSLGHIFRINFSNFLPSLPSFPDFFLSDLSLSPCYLFCCLQVHLSLKLQLLFLCLYLALPNVLRYPYSVPIPSLYSPISPGATPERSCPENKSFFPLPMFLIFSAE